ncbi:hypothetical protein NPX13_g7864 [Xylaria arbuscula]|uniref:Heterokaryon incompatibility domain-containing protein n=1 Tax=Xylaria arbuscula TaxID=114810 RepID=A0A9W8TKD5_9PEZI|nr:hypothetical protein NPX13_g7864 [Xylaria arbuscula]
MSHPSIEMNVIRELEEGTVADPARTPNDGSRYNEVTGGRQDHKDSLNRYVQIQDTDKYKDHYLNPDDGKLVLLRVQCAKDYSRDETLVTTWDDPIKPRPLVYAWKALRKSPKKILTWTYNDRLREKGVSEGSLPAFGISYDRSEIYWKYPIASLFLTFTALFGNFEGKTYPGGRYPPVRYKYFSYPKTPRNKGETAEYYKSTLLLQQSRDLVSSGSTTPQLESEDFDSVEDGVLIFRRHLRPRKLCVFTDDSTPLTSFHVDVVDSIECDDDVSTNEKGEYVFVSYTRDQFHTYTSDDMKGWEMPTAEEKRRVREFQESHWKEDRQRLVEIGVQAARDAGVKAFWIDVFCMDDAKLNTMDSHRICDVARGAKSMVIALQNTVETRALDKPAQSVDNMLRSWSSRLWTLPEMVLAPTRHDLKIYLATNGVSLHETIPKRSMAARAYGADGVRVRQLVDHFEASQQLTLTELLTIGLECLIHRQTYRFMPADQVYALMTMVRRRPKPDKNDTLFEAFAKLSLLNDSNSLLERLICILPECRGEPWYVMKDFWGVKPWDIEPTIQVSAIASDQTVILDGAFGASISWEELTPVGFLKRETILRSIGSFIVRFAPGWLIISIFLLVSYGQPIPSYNLATGHYTHKVSPLVAVGIVFFIIAFAAVASLPYVMMSLYSGKFWSTQALLFGLEGQADLEWLELQLFGFTQGRLRWSTWSSTQSLHRSKPTTGGAKYIDGEVEELEPTATPLRNNNPEITDVDRVFTIVDTYSMTATLIRAVHPPTTALVCGQEGGMRRVLLCSYDYSTQTFHRETVVRMPTKVLDRMDRVDRFRFSMANMPLGTGKGEVGHSSTGV